MTMTSLRALRTRGFSKLRSGRIHLRCPLCGRKMSNARRSEYDPPSAVLAEVACDKHSGLKDPPTNYFDKEGVEVEDDGEEGA